MFKSHGREVPIFVKQKINYTPAHHLTHLTASNNKIVLALTDKTLLKIDYSFTESPKTEEIDLKHGTDGSDLAKLSNIYIDPSGQHLILSYSPKDSANLSEIMYLPPNNTRPKEIVKMKSHIVTAVAWNPVYDRNMSLNSSYPFLLGTSKGIIFEAEIINGEIKYCKQIYDIAGGTKGNASVISGLEYFFLPSSNKVFVLVATSKKLYQFKGFIGGSREDRPWFQNIFNNYLNKSLPEDFFSEFPEPKVNRPSDQCISRLNILYDKTGYPKAIAYLNDSGSLLYNNVLAKNNNPEDTFLVNGPRIEYPKIEEASGIYKTPKNLLLTDYHILLLYKDCIRGISALNEEIVFQDNFNEGRGRIINLIRDPVKETIWGFTENQINRFPIYNEDRNVWKIYLDKEDFIKAEEFSNNDPEILAEINIKRGDHFFAHKKFEMSAMYYALTKISFEEIALKFVQINDSAALKTFLLKKLSSLKSSSEMTKISTLVMWIIEIYLNELGELRDFGKDQSAKYRNLEEDFLQFMTQPAVKNCVTQNKKAVYDLMASHGDKENLVHFTIVMKDFEELIENNIANGQYGAAFAILEKQKNVCLYMKFIPTLIDKDPKATMDSLISAGRILNPIKLLPKFSSNLNKNTATEITRYLEHCVNNLQISDQQLNDYLISMYVHFYKESVLMNYLQDQGQEVHRVNYDPKFALMMCLEKKLNLATIYLYNLMGLHEDAVALAIQFDLELAKKTANMPGEDDEELRKKLWLKIAKHVVKEKNDIQQAMKFLEQCELLKIEDILPLFPNFTTIDHFKEAICSSLQEYNQHIQNLKEEMDEATKSAEIIREEIQSVRNRCAVIRATDICTVCNVSLLVKNFYVFPCGHLFHADCLMSEVYPSLNKNKREQLKDCQNKLAEVTLRHEIISVGSSVISTRDQIKSDIDDIIASECFYCGDYMIKLIDEPFIPEHEFDRILKDWE